MRKKIVIIGAGIAGLAAAEAARQTDEQAEIILLAAEEWAPCYRLRLAEVLPDPSKAAKLLIHPLEWYAEKGISLRLNCAVEAWDSSTKSLTLLGGEQLNYDELIYTAGSSSFVPPLSGFDLANCFTLWSLASACHFAAAIQSQKLRHCVVIGGGLLGLEAAWQLLAAGLQVSIVEKAERLLARQLDPRASEILQQHLGRLGVKVYTAADCQAIVGSADSPSQVRALRLQNQVELACDAVLMSVGVLANTALAAQAGLTVKRRVCVNTAMQTNLPHVYAAGDVCEVDDGFWFGLWAIAKEQGTVAGSNAAGANRLFTPSTPPYLVNTMQTRIASQGFNPNISPAEAAADADLRLEISEDEAKCYYRKLIWRGANLVGFCLLGEAAKEQASLQKQLAKHAG